MGYVLMVYVQKMMKMKRGSCRRREEKIITIIIIIKIDKIMREGQSVKSRS